MKYNLCHLLEKNLVFDLCLTIFLLNGHFMGLGLSFMDHWLYFASDDYMWSAV